MLLGIFLEFLLLNILLPALFLLFFSYPSALIIFFIALAAFFNGNADATAFRFNRVLWRHILKGWLLDWYEGKYFDKLHKWYIHPIFWDGWHFFKNATILSFLTAILIALNIQVHLLRGIILLIISSIIFSVLHDQWLTIHNEPVEKDRSKVHLVLRRENALDE